MIQLPNGCKCSGIPGNPKKGIPDQLNVFPKDWNTPKAKVRLDWYIHYRFYQPGSPPKQNIIKGFNSIRDLKAKQQAVRERMEQELANLRGIFDPSTGTFTREGFIMPETALCDALDRAFPIVRNKADSTKANLKWVLRFFQEAAKIARLSHLKIDTVSRKHIYTIFDVLARTKANWGPHMHNQFRTYLSILFEVLIDREAITRNVVKEIRKEKVVKKQRRVVTDEEFESIEQFLKIHYPAFNRFRWMFFCSGARITEILSLKVKDVDLKNQKAVFLVKKGRYYEEKERVIINQILPLWREHLKDAQPDDYVFHVGLLPGAGDKPIRSEQIARRWREHVKKKLAITADFYTHKHLFTTKVVDLFGSATAALHNAHATTRMVDTVYDIGSRKRKDDILKGLKLPFNNQMSSPKSEELATGNCNAESCNEVIPRPVN